MVPEKKNNKSDGLKIRELQFMLNLKNREITKINGNEMELTYAGILYLHCQSIGRKYS